MRLPGNSPGNKISRAAANLAGLGLQVLPGGRLSGLGYFI
jgi:hypothetical protein